MTSQQPSEPNRPDFVPHWRTWPDTPEPPAPPQPPVPEGAFAQAEPRWSARRKIAALGAALVLAMGAGSAGAAIAVAAAGDRTIYSSPTSVSGASAKVGTVAQVAAAVQPSVVSIQSQSQQGTSSGSGVVLRSDGVIMTNAHVVSGSGQLTVKFSNGKTAPARVLGADTRSDIAVLKAE